MSDTTTDHFARSVVLAEKITVFVERAIAPLDRTIGEWRPNFGRSCGMRSPSLRRTELTRPVILSLGITTRDIDGKSNA